MYISRVLETSLRDMHFFACLVYTRINTFAPGKQLPKVLYDKHFHMSDLDGRRCSTQEMFLKNLQNSQENTCARVSLFKDKASIQVPPDEFCYIFKTLLLENNLLYLSHYSPIASHLQTTGYIR